MTTIRGSMLHVPIDKIVQGGPAEKLENALTIEESLEIRVGGRNLSVTMRTPGNDYELAAGSCFPRGL